MMVRLRVIANQLVVHDNFLKHLSTVIANHFSFPCCSINCPCYHHACTLPGVYGLSLYIDVHGDPESWNCAGNLGILGLGWGVVASFHALRKVVKAGDGALAKLKVVNSSSLQGEQGAGAGRSQLRLLSVRSTSRLLRWLRFLSSKYLGSVAYLVHKLRPLLS